MRVLAADDSGLVKTDQIWSRPPIVNSCLISRNGHGNVDILEEVARSDADGSIVELDKIVAFSATVLATERIGEAEVGIEFFGFDQKSGAVRLPLGGFHRHAHPNSGIFDGSDE